MYIIFKLPNGNENTETRKATLSVFMRQESQTAMDKIVDTCQLPPALPATYVCFLHVKWHGAVLDV